MSSCVTLCSSTCLSVCLPGHDVPVLYDAMQWVVLFCDHPCYKGNRETTSKWAPNINTAVCISFKRINILLRYCKVNYRYVLRLMDKAFFVTTVFVCGGTDMTDSSIKI